MPAFTEDFVSLADWALETGSPTGHFVTAAAPAGLVGITTAGKIQEDPGVGFAYSRLDLVDGGVDATEYWITYAFYVVDWADFSPGSGNYFLLPGLSYSNDPDTQSGNGNFPILKATSTISGYFQGQFGPPSAEFADGTWHTMRMGMISDTITPLTQVDTYFDGVLLDSTSFNSAFSQLWGPTLYDDQGDMNGAVVYVAALNYNPGSDPGEPAVIIPPTPPPGPGDYPGGGGGPPVPATAATAEVGVFIDGVDVTGCVRSGSVTRRLNRPWQASVQLYSECATGDACSRLKVTINNTLWFHGFVTQISTEAGEDGALISEYTALDPMFLWQWRPARDPDGDFSNPSFFKTLKYGPAILQSLLEQSEDDSDPGLGEGPLFIDLAGATYDTGVKSLRGAPTDWPMTIAECFELMSSTGVLDAVLQPIDVGGNMASLTVKNGDYGNNLTASVNFDYAMGDHNVRTVRMTEDSTNLVNKLWYYLGPRIETPTDPAGDQHWRANITGTHPSFNPNISAQGAWGLSNSYSQLDTVTHTVAGDSITFVCVKSHTSTTRNEPGIGKKWGLFWAFYMVPPGGRSVDGTNTPAGPPWTDNQLGERIWDSRSSGCGVRMEVRIYDGQGDENPAEFRELYERLWQEESWLRAIPRTLVHVTPVRQSDNMQLPPGVNPVIVGAFDIGDLVTVNIGSIVRGGSSGAQRIYEYTVSWDEDGIVEVGELLTSADQEGL